MMSISVVSVKPSSRGRRETTVRESRKARASGAERDTDFVDTIGELFVLAENPGELPEIIAANCEHLAVEVLSLHLDGCKEPFDQVALRAVEISKPGEIDRDRLAIRIDHHRGRLGWQQLHHGNAVVAGESMESWNREAALAAFVGAKDGCLELTFRDALDVLE